MKRKKIYLLLEVIVLFFVFVQYMVNITVEERGKGQAVFSENAEGEQQENGTGIKIEDNKKKEEESEEAISQDLVNQVEQENGIENHSSQEESLEKDSNQMDNVEESYREEVENVSNSSIDNNSISDKEENNTEEKENNQIDIETQKIRVLLKTTGNKGNYHESVKLKPSKDCTLSIIGNSSKTKVLKAGKSYIFKASSSWLKKGTVLLTPKKDGKIKVCSIERACGNPSYRGTLELIKTKQGILIINELLLEEYLYAVVPSEMPVSYGIESLKVQAVCARCYAYSQLKSSAMEEFYADVDDSTSYQVYNNVAETIDSKKAVDLTKGLVPVLENGKMITAYYYSTSCGYTANIEDAWEREENNNQKEEKKNSYLIGKPQFIKSKEAQKELDLSTEKNFLDFIEKETRQTFDSAFPWYRWTVSISKKTLQSSIEKNWENRKQANPSMMEIKKNQKNVDLEKEEWGTWKGIEIISRSVTGMVTCIKITYSKVDLYVYGEYNIRCLLAPENTKIKRQDGSIVNGLTILPSSFFSVEKKNNNFIFTGGGYGHGVGMSQNGVKTMAELGYHWEEILKHYYQGIRIENVENLVGL